MPEREFKINITGDANSLVSESRRGAESLGELASGAEKNATWMDTLNPKTRQYVEHLGNVREGTEKTEISSRELRRSLGMLGPEFAEAGHAAVESFSNPMMLGLLASVGVLKLFDEALEKLSEEDTSKLGITSIAPKIKDLNEQIQAAIASLQEFYDKIDRATDAEAVFATQSERYIEVQKAQNELAKKTIDLEEKLGLMSRERAEHERQRLERTERENEITAKRNQADKFKQEASDTEKDLPMLADMAQKANELLKENEERIAKTRKNVETWKPLADAHKLSGEDYLAYARAKSQLQIFEDANLDLKIDANRANNAYQEAQGRVTRDRAQAYRLGVESNTAEQLNTAQNDEQNRQNTLRTMLAAGFTNPWDKRGNVGLGLLQDIDMFQARAHGVDIGEMGNASITALTQLLHRQGLGNAQIQKLFADMLNQHTTTADKVNEMAVALGVLKQRVQAIASNPL